MNTFTTTFTNGFSVLTKNVGRATTEGLALGAVMAVFSIVLTGVASGIMQAGSNIKGNLWTPPSDDAMETIVFSVQPVAQPVAQPVPQPVAA